MYVGGMFFVYEYLLILLGFLFLYLFWGKVVVAWIFIMYVYMILKSEGCCYF